MLQLKNIHCSYDAKDVLNGINLELRRGEVHGILGMNGAGKTTLFNTIYGLKKAYKGDIQFEGDKLKETIGFLQTHNFFYPLMKGKEYLALLGLNANTNVIEQWNKVFDLPLNEMVENYSTGMKKKLAFLGIILMKKNVLLLDEPFNGVDVESNEKMMFIINKMKESEKGIIISSHILSSLLNTCDRISHLEKGKIKRTYLKREFSDLELMIKESIRHSLGNSLDELMK